MDKFTTMRFRKHPGGFQNWVYTFRILLPVALVLAILFFGISFVMMVQKDCTVSVEGINKTYSNIVNSDFGNLRGPRITGVYSFRPRNVFERFFMSGTYKNIGVTAAFFNLLIVFYLYRMFRILNLDKPFSLQVAYYIRSIGKVWIIAYVANGLIGLYASNIISTLTNGAYRTVYENSFIQGVFPGIVILIIAEIYKKGCVLQEEKDLTI